MKCKKLLKHHSFLRLFAIFLSCVVFLSSTIGINAEEVTPVPDEPQTYTIQEFMSIYHVDFYDIMSFFSRYYKVFPDIYGNNTISLQAFLDWYEEKYGTALDDFYVIEHQGGGRGYDVSEEIRQDIVDYVQEEYIDQVSLGYSYQRIYSYNTISSELFNTQLQMEAFKNEISKLENVPYVFIPWYGNVTNITGAMYWDEANNRNVDIKVGNGPNDTRVFLYYAPSNGLRNIDWYSSSGHLENYINVQTMIPTSNWQSIANWNSSNNTVMPTGWHGVAVWPNGQVKAVSYLFRPNIGTYRNTSYLQNYATYGSFSVFSTKGNNETVYLFDSLNAIKSFNAQEPQAYYTPSNSTDVVPYVDPFDVSDLTSAGSYYSSIVDNSVSGMSADDVIKLVDLIINGGSGGGGSGGSGGNDDKSAWETIGEAIAGLISGIVTVVSKVATALKDAILGLLDIFIGEDGLFSKLSELVNTNFSGFLSAVFGWLPPEIVTLFSATLVFGIFFAIWRMLRG